jgi:hypothetical protein
LTTRMEEGWGVVFDIDEDSDTGRLEKEEPCRIVVVGVSYTAPQIKEESLSSFPWLGVLVGHLVGSGLCDTLLLGDLLGGVGDGLLLVRCRRCEDLDALLDHRLDVLALRDLVSLHPHLEEHSLALLLHLRHLLHRLECRLHRLSVVLDGPIPSLLELVC